MDALYPTLYPRLVSYARVRGHPDAEAFAQEVFCRALAGRRVRNPQWLWGIARNLMVDHWRRARLITFEPLPEHVQAPAPAVSRELLRRAIRELTPRQRLVIYCRFYQGLSPEETAAVLSVGTGAAKLVQHRALARLRHLLEECA